MWLGKRVFAAGMALTLAAALTGCAAGTAQEQQAAAETILTGAAADKAKSYETYEAVPGDIIKSGSLTLNVVYTQQQTLCAPENGLELETLLVGRGEQLAEGEAIATFRRDTSAADLAEAELALSHAQASLTEQLTNLQEAIETASPYQGTELGNCQYELAQLAYDRAAYLGQRQIAQLQENLTRAQEAYEVVTLKAPYDCIVDSVAYLYDQQKVGTSTVIVEVSRLSSMALLGTTASNNFQYGNEIMVEYGRKDRRVTAPARVVSTSTLLQQDKEQIWVMLDEPVAEAQLTKPTAQTEFVQIRDALTVPRTAIESENGSNYVQILVDGVAHKRYIIRGVTVGSVGENHVVVLAGLELGQLVITN